MIVTIAEEVSPYMLKSIYVRLMLIFIKLKNSHFAIGSVYRPPLSNVKYFDYINDDLEFITSKGYDIIVLGYFNVDYSATEFTFIILKIDWI